MEDDVVVEELDVFVSQSLKDDLSVLQAPMRATWRPLDYSTLVSAKMKPKSRKLAMSFSLDKENEHYDTTSNYCCDTFDVQSTVTTNRQNYVVGLRRGNQIHLHPISRIVQLRPSFQHVDKAKPLMVSAENELDDEDDDKIDVKDEPKQQKQFRRRETADAMKARLNSYNHFQQLEETDVFVDVKWNKSDSKSSRAAFEKLVSSSNHSIPFPLSAGDYISLLHPPPEDEKTGQLSLQRIRKLDPENQIKALLLLGNVLRFSRICELLNSNSSQHAGLLNALKSNGLVVQGAWAIKSHIKYQPAHEVDARDFLLYLFYQHPVVTYGEFFGVVATLLTPEKVKQMLSELAEQQPTGMWVWKRPTDTEFMESHADLMSDQEAFWAKRVPQLMQRFPETDVTLRTTNPFPIWSLSAFLFRVARSVGICSFEHLRNSVFAWKRRTGNATQSISARDEDILQAVSEVCVSLHGRFVPKTVNDPGVDCFRDAAITCFRESTSVPISQLRARMFENAQVEPGYITFHRIMAEFADPVDENGEISEKPTAIAWVLRAC